jgi:preprotein translocase subunit SecD
MRRSLVYSLIAIIAVAVLGLGANIAAGNKPLLGLDLQGGASVVLQPSGKVDNGTLNQAIAIIRKRVDALGVAEANISRQGHNVVIELPGIKDPQTALQTVGQTAELRFRPVLCAVNPAKTPAAPAAPTAPYSATTCGTLGADGGASLPSTAVSQDSGKGYALLPQLDTKGVVVGRYLLAPTALTGRVVSTASAQAPQVGGNWSVQVNLTNSGSSQFDSMAAQNVNKQVAIVLDGLVESAPTIQTNSFHGVAQITGNFTQKQASNLALQLRYGSLPVQFTPQSIQAVSATIGKDSLRAGLLAGAIGIGLVLSYILLYYRALGVVVILGLAVSGALLWSIISALSQSSGLALSLAGATGIIVSVGVTVDSYIVYFERLKDDIRQGKSVRTSVDKSFSRAYKTILAADFVSFLAAAILYLTTVGSVRGFAFFLGLSTLLDVFTAFLFTRPMVVLLGRNRFFTEARYFGVARGLAATPPPGAAPAGGTA